MNAKVQEAWSKAGKRLGFRFLAPHEIEDSGKKIGYDGLVPDFGGPSGTVFLASESFSEDTTSHAEAAKKMGLYFSFISAAVYESSDDAVFIEALSDWGWFGQGPQPTWIQKEPNQPPEPMSGLAPGHGSS